MSKQSLLQSVEFDAADPCRYLPVLESDQDAFGEAVRRAPRDFEGRRVWNVNSTSQGGGVAEMLWAMLPTIKGAGVDVRWLVLQADPSFFELTKRLHNLLHAGPSTPVPDLDPDRELYDTSLQGAVDALGRFVRPGDVLIVHDPQPAGLVAEGRRLGATVIWRCHIGTDRPGPAAKAAWDFLLPHVSAADAFIFSRQAFVWDCIDPARTTVIQPSIDPLSPKNQALAPADVQAILEVIGLAQPGGGSGRPVFQHGQRGERSVRRRAEIVQDGPVPMEAPIVAQVSRWDPLKDPIGVLAGFTAHVPPSSGAHLVLAGPDVSGVSDDPEGQAVWQAVQRRWHQLPEDRRRTVHLVSLPMEDLEENAAMVNAIQRRAAVVVQKSLEEGFGLTVTEAMWKGRPVVASRRGGIQDQIEHAVSGILLDDPHDLAAFGQAVSGLLADRERAERLGEAAHDRVLRDLLTPAHLRKWLALIERISAQSGDRTRP